jgi:hypothetical protein
LKVSVKWRDARGDGDKVAGGIRGFINIKISVRKK